MVYRFCKKEYIPMNTPQGGDENTSSVDEDEAGCYFILVSEGNVRDSGPKLSTEPFEAKGDKC